MRNLILILLCTLSVGVFAQAPPVKLQELPMGGAPTQVNTAYGLGAKQHFFLPKKDTLNNPIAYVPGSLTIRPQDTGASKIPTLYVSNGKYWYSIGKGVDTVQTSVDSVNYIALLQGTPAFTFPTLLTRYGPGYGIYFTKGPDSIVRVNANNRVGDSIYADITKKYLTILHETGLKDSFKFRLKDTSVIGGGSLTFDTSNIMRYVTTFAGSGGAIPYARNSDGFFLFDVAGFSYDGTNVSVGHNNAGTYSGFNINGGRAGIYAALGGMLLNVGSGFVPGTYDAVKSYTFQNRGNTYFQLYTTGAAGGPWTHHGKFYTDLNIQVTPNYADNTVALAAGLVAGDVYRTGDLLKIVH